ncbi:MAG TPA: ABC transporter substrate-binding protein, partial [Acidimicrobiales bacterium]|nr:ABC transporter substrate-binding protein [Acidimicrobiales bacterium]
DAYGDCSSSKITVIQNIDVNDYEASTANVVYEYAPLGSSQVGDIAAAPEPEPLVGSVIRMALEADGDGLNPTVNRFAVSAYQMGRAVYEPLVYLTDDPCGCVYSPGLAESWTHNDDLSVWDFKIRENVMFHDGTMLTGETVEYAINQQLKDQLISLAFRPIFIPQGAVELVDDMTVRFNLQRPHVSFPLYLTSQLGYIPSLEYMKATISDGSLNQAPVGTGPFRFDSREQDYMTRFVRNEDWWQGEVVPAAVEFYIYTDTVLAADAMAVGDIDIMHTSNVDAILALRDLEATGGGLQLFEEDIGEEGFGMLNSAKAPFNDIRARKALAYAAPLDNYIEFIGQGVLRPAETWFPPESPYHNPDVVQEHDMPEMATPLVESYCAELPENCTDGRINMEFQYSGPSVIQERIYDILTDGWSDHFEITKDMQLQDDHITQVALGQYDWVTWRQMGFADPDGDVTWLNCSAVGFLSLNWPRTCDEERDELMYQARGSQDLDERVALWQQIAQKINQDYTYIIYNHTVWAHAYGPDVTGVCGYILPDGSTPRCNWSGYTSIPSTLDKPE